MLWPLTTPAAVDRIRRRNGVLAAYVNTRLEEALQESEARASQVPASALHGVPYGLKDDWDTAGFATTGGSYRHRRRVPTASSRVHEAFQSAGAILLGKTNLSDMGLAPEATNFIAGATRNPHNLARSAGGSSGGAAAAVADGMAAFDWGTDIGGSIRMPAAFCGIFGMRLSSETWPILDLFPKLPSGLAWMCGQGPLTRTLEQMKVVLAAAAPHLKTGPSRPFIPDHAVVLAPDRKGQWSTFSSDVTPHVTKMLPVSSPLDENLEITKAVHHIYNSLWASHFEDLLTADDTIVLSEGLRAVGSSVLFRGAFGDYRFHPTTAEILALIVIGRYTIFRNRHRALDNAAKYRESFDSAWRRGTVVVAPVCMYPAPRIGRSNWNPNLLSCTVLGNIVDATSLSIPFGRFDDGLPRGIQIMGPPGSEETLIALAEKFIASRDENPALRPSSCIKPA